MRMKIQTSLEPFHQHYNQHGYVVFKTGIVEDWILDLLAEHIGLVRGFWGRNHRVDYRPENPEIPTAVSIAQSANQMRPHTDGTWDADLPPSQLLQCVENDLPGYGLSRLVDSWKVVEALTPNSRIILMETPFEFYYKFDERKQITLKIPIIDTAFSPHHFRYRNDKKHQLIPPNKQVEKALKELDKLIDDPEFYVEFQLLAGDVLWLNNRRMLHGRTALSGKSKRYMRRYWVQDRSL